MKNLDLKEKAKILKNELERVGQKLGHVQTLNILAKLEGCKNHSEYQEKQKNKQTIKIDKEIWNSFVSKREDFGVPVEIQLETLIEQEIYQISEEVKLYKYEDSNFDTYFTFAKSKHDALSLIDASYLPPSIYDIERVREVRLEELYGVVIANKWKGIDDDYMYNQYESELIDVNGSMAIFSETLTQFDYLLQDMELVDGQIVPNHKDSQILKWLEEKKEEEPEKYKKYMKLHKTVLDTDKIVKGE